MTEPKDPTVEIAREVMGRVAASVEVVTLVDAEGVLRGMTISSLSQVSADPPSLLICVGSAASARPAFAVGQTFCVNVLSSDQVAQSIGFAYGTEDPFAVFDWSPASDGTPILAGTTAHLLCEVEKVVVHHETAVVLAKVIGGVTHKDEALVYWLQRYYGDLATTEPVEQGSW